MLSFFGSLTMSTSKAPAPQRSVVTPGQLYRILSSEFRLQRSPRCSCRMPMIQVTERPEPEAANWNVEPMSRKCAACSAIVSRLVAHFTEIYDMQDPDSWPEPGVESTPSGPSDESFSGGQRTFG